jgi:hypothetical protein
VQPLIEGKHGKGKETKKDNAAHGHPYKISFKKLSIKLSIMPYPGQDWWNNCTAYWSTFDCYFWYLYEWLRYNTLLFVAFPHKRYGLFPPFPQPFDACKTT